MASEVGGNGGFAIWDPELGLLEYDEKRERFVAENQERVKQVIVRYRYMGIPEMANFIATTYLERKPRGWLSRVPRSPLPTVAVLRADDV